MSKTVIALGGNALGKTPEEQLELLKKVAKVIVDLVKKGEQIVLTHGNGPQVGAIVKAMTFSNENGGDTPLMPFPECGSMSQGYIGYHLQQSLQNELKKEHLDKNCVTVVTQVLVDKDDEAFNNPTKPIGSFITKEEALRQEQETNYKFVEDSGRGYRRVVASPNPIKIVESKPINELIENGNLVIAIGGGGVPVILENDELKGVDAVIDKDRSASLMGREINADNLVILTAVDKVYLNYNTPNEIGLDMLTTEQIEAYKANNQFAKGSMLPKIEACNDFVKGSDKKKAIICLLENAGQALSGETGTIIKWR